MNPRFEDIRQSEEWAKYLSHLGWQAEKLKVKGEKFKVYIRELPLVGSVIKIQRPSVIPPIGEIDKIAEKHSALFIKLEPPYQQFNHLTIKQFSPDSWPLLPSKTIWIDLNPDEEEILANFSKDGRYSIRKSERLGVAVRTSEDLKTFHNLFQTTGKRKNFWVPPFADLQAKIKAFENKFALLLAYQKSEVVAGALILFHDQVAYYHHAASNLKGRQLLAPYLIVWEAIKLAKKKNCQILDLEGIYDSRYRTYRRWKNISIFKRKFGGKEVEYPGSHIRFYNPVIKTIFRFGDSLTQVGI